MPPATSVLLVDGSLTASSLQPATGAHLAARLDAVDLLERRRADESFADADGTVPFWRLRYALLGLKEEDELNSACSNTGRPAGHPEAASCITAPAAGSTSRRQPAGLRRRRAGDRSMRALVIIPGTLDLECLGWETNLTY